MKRDDECWGCGRTDHSGANPGEPLGGDDAAGGYARNERDHILNAIEPGDVVFAIANDGTEKILLVYRTTRIRIFARLVTSQTKIKLARDGVSVKVDGDYTCTIVSAAPLPVEEYEVVRGLERKMRLAHSIEHIALTEAEKKLLLHVGDFYKSRLLPND